MKTKLQNVFECEHCSRKMLGKGAMSRHEKFCSQNPNNWHKCFDYCEHLKKEHEIIEVDEMPLRITHFICMITGYKLYSYKFEKTRGFKSIYLNGLIRMPLECEYYSGPESNEEFFDGTNVDSLY